MDILNPKYANLQEVASAHREAYYTNPPFPNIHFDDFLNPKFLDLVLGEFPDLDKKKDKIYYNNPNEDKYASKGEYSFGPHTKRLVHFLNSQPFLEFLQELTGIAEPLIPDPYFEGGGFHQIKRGGFLKIHVDFHKHRKMNLDRRLNILVYLNKDWDDSYGGHFELWEKDMSKSVTKIAPYFNRVALFSTTGNSWHGHPDQLNCPEDRSRKSLALYYYSNGRPNSEVDISQQGRITTTFADRKGIDDPKMKRYNNMVNLVNDILPPVLVRAIKKFRNT